MIQVLWLLMAQGANATRPYSKTCPKVMCAESLPGGVCLLNDSAQGEVLVAPCQGWETCPVPNDLESLTSLKCYDSRLDKYATGAQTFAEYLDAKVRWVEFTTQEQVNYQIRQENEACYNRWDRCNPEKGLVCQCDGFCRCVQGAQEGEVCSSFETAAVPMCAHGYGCHKGYCVPWFSRNEGEVVTDAWVCSSMDVDPVTHQCLPSDFHTTSQLQTPCGNDEDCRGVHGIPGTCSCGINGLAYCQLLPNDEAFINYQSAITGLNIEEMSYWSFVIDFWVHLVRHLGNEDTYTYLNPVTCQGNVWPLTTRYYDQVQTDLDQIPSQASLLLLGLSTLFLLN